MNPEAGLPDVRRSTLARPETVQGIGIHTGASVGVTLVPAAEEEATAPGVIFRVAGSKKEIPALVSNVVDTARCTVLGSGGVTVATVEHLLSALCGMNVSDVIVEVDGPELPIGDGSALVWTQALAAAGTVPLADVGDETRKPLALEEPIVVYGDRGAFVAAYPSEALRLTVAIQFDHPMAGTQVARWEPMGTGASYSVEIAPARTFGFDFEVEALRAAGLARGGSLENALVIYDDRYSSPLRFPDELARHKLLDLIGDLALVGVPIVADIVAVRPSHRLNVALANRLAAFFR